MLFRSIAGLATAWLAISNPSLLKRYNLQAERNGTWHGNVIGFEATKAAYSSQGEEWLSQLLTYLWSNYNLVKNFLEAELPKIKLIEPEGTYLLWLDFREYNLPHDKLVELLVSKAEVGFNSGDMFGVEGSGFQRMNIACPTKTVQTVLDRLKSTFGNL